MKYKANIDIMPLEALLDPQGKAVTQSMGNLGLDQVNNVRIGKHITMLVDSDNQDNAESIIKEACVKLLCNQIMESYQYTIQEVI